MNTETHPLVVAVREAARNNPDKIARCRYVDHGQPECIVGVGLHAIGVPIDSLYAVEGDGIEHPRARLLAGGLTQAAVDWLTLVQTTQDEGAAWAAAIKYADEHESIGVPADA